MIGQHDEGGEIVIQRAEAVAGPTACAGKSRQLEAGGLQQRGGRVDAGFADHVMNEGHVVHDRAERCDGVAQHLAALPVGLEVPHWLEPRTETILKGFDMLAEVTRLPVALHQLRLVIKQVEVAGSTGHEELHDALGLGGMMQFAIAARAGWLAARNLLSRPPHRGRSEWGSVPGSEGVWGERGAGKG